MYHTYGILPDYQLVSDGGLSLILLGALTAARPFVHIYRLAIVSLRVYVCQMRMNNRVFAEKI